ncbi:hypothetical protein MNBD_GAMMA06-1219 [hydrothermal vent metagenome]|uniref:Uncharacterized protein n=1 Tax=hydrothermal vent metagenome TaxID=652676 RepID=A0A3B0WJF7_9ZZZZ
MKIPTHSIALTFLLLSGYASNYTTNTEVTEIKPDLNMSQEIMQRSSQGNYKITFRIYDKNSNYNDQLI